MEPIISPWLIYALPLVNVFIGVMATISLLTLAMLIIAYTDNEFREDRGTILTKILWAVFIISSLLAILTPSKNTLIAMYIANHVTPDNLSNAQEIITTIIKQAK